MQSPRTPRSRGGLGNRTINYNRTTTKSWLPRLRLPKQNPRGKAAPGRSSPAVGSLGRRLSSPPRRMAAAERWCRRHRTGRTARESGPQDSGCSAQGARRESRPSRNGLHPHNVTPGSGCCDRRPGPGSAALGPRGGQGRGVQLRKALQGREMKHRPDHSPAPAVWVRALLTELRLLRNTPVLLDSAHTALTRVAPRAGLYPQSRR